MMRLLAAALLGLSILLPPGPAWAKDGPSLPKPDPKGVWRVITQDDATTTSKCIGSTATPLCAMETAIAGRVRGDWAMFDKAAFVLPGEHHEPIGTPFVRREGLRYRILSAEILTERQIPPPFLSCHMPDNTDCKELLSAWRPGDVRIKITSRECWNSECSRAESDERGHVLRRVGDGWKVVLMRPSVTQIHDIDGKPLERR